MYVFFWVFPRRLIKIVVCRRFGTLLSVPSSKAVCEVRHIQPLKMKLIECSETSAYCNFNQTPGKYPKEYIHLDSKHGESLKSRIFTCSWSKGSMESRRRRRWSVWSMPSLFPMAVIFFKARLQVSRMPRLVSKRKTSAALPSILLDIRLGCDFTNY